MDIETMTNGYLSAALFTADEECVAPMSGQFTERADYRDLLARFPAKVRAAAAKLCAEFYRDNAADMPGYPPFAAGSDLWYTRCGHGCGFWEADHCTKEQGERLTAAAKKLGERAVIKVRGWFYIE